MEPRENLPINQEGAPQPPEAQPPIPEVMPGSQAAEQNLVNPELQGQPSGGMSLPPVPAQPLPQVPQPQQQPQQPQQQQDSGAQSQGPSVADDVDLIEKEWVMKAQDIVEQTKDDPHEQNKQVNFLKADYMKKRYNKDIKLVDD